MVTVIAGYYSRSFIMNGNRERMFVASCLLLKLFAFLVDGNDPTVEWITRGAGS